MSILNSRYMPVGNMEMLGNWWPDTDGPVPMVLDSFLASIFQDLDSPSCSSGHVPHFADLEDESDGQVSRDEFSVADLPVVYMAPDGFQTVSYGDPFSVEDSGDGPTNIMVSKTPSQPIYTCHDVLLEGLEEFATQGRRFSQASVPTALSFQTSRSNSRLADYGEACQKSQHADEQSRMRPVLEEPAAWCSDLPPSPNMFSSEQALAPGGVPVTLSSSLEEMWEDGAATGRWPTSTQSWTVNSTSQSPVFNNSESVGDATQLLVAGDSPGGRVSSAWGQPAVEMSGFVGLSDFLSAPLLSSVGHVTAKQLQRANLRKDISRARENSLEHMKSIQGHNVMVSGLETTNGNGGRTSTAFGFQEQSEPVHAPSSNPPALQTPAVPVHQEEPKRMPVNALAPVTPEKPARKRTCLSHNVRHQPAKLPKLAPSIGPNLAFQKVELRQPTPLLGVQGGGETSFVSADASNTVFSAPNGVVDKGRDHVARERRRRDLMNSRYQTLEALLPKLPSRRDRFVIVEDTKAYVKLTEQKLSVLRKTREDCQNRLEAAKEATKAHAQGKKKVVAPEPTAGANFSPLTGTEVPDSSMSKDSNLEIVMDTRDEEQEVVVLVQWRSNSGAKVFSTLLRAMDNLQLDVSQCSTSKCSDFFFCNAVCKLQPHVDKSTLSREKMTQEMVTTLHRSLKGKGPAKSREAC